MYRKYSEIRKVYSRKALLKTLLARLKFKLFPKSPEYAFREVCQFTGATVKYAFKRATVERESFVDTFTSKPRKTEGEIRSAYTETDVWLYSQVYNHRSIERTFITAFTVKCFKPKRDL